MKFRWVAGLVCLFVLSHSLSAQTVVIPPANAGTAGNGGLNTVIRDINAPRTYQMQIVAAELAGLPIGASVTGIHFRLFNGATNQYPPAGGATWADYEITLSQAVNTVPTMSTTFLSNMTNSVLVRDGSLTLPENSFGIGGNPNTWGPNIAFQTPYTYQGGDLVILIAHTGSNITNPVNTFADALTTASPGYGTNFRAFSGTTFNALTGAQTSFTISQLEFITSVPEPTTWALMGFATVGAVGGFWRFRRRQAQLLDSRLSRRR